MHFKPEISAEHFPAALKKFIEITGIREWGRRIGWITTQFQQNEFLRGYLNQIYSVELEFASLLIELEETGRINTRLNTPERYRLFAFITTVTLIYERLTPRGQARLRGMILGGLRDKGLTPVQQEISVASQLLNRGFDVTFSDLETGSAFDFLARKDGIELEVECKRVGLDLGRKIPRLEVLGLHSRIYDEVEPTFGKLRCGLFMRVVLPDRLTSNITQQETIASVVGGAFHTGVERTGQGCRVEVDSFELQGTPFQRVPNEAEKHRMRLFIEKRFNSKNRELFILGSAGKRALVISVESEKPDSLLNNLFSELKTSAKTQFSKKRPGVLCVQFIDMTNEQIQRIDSATDDSEPKRPSALLVKTSDFLNSEKRGHILSVAFLGHGLVSRSSSQQGNVKRDTIQEQGNAYFVTNEKHPLAKDRRYAIYASDHAQGRILVIKHRARPR